MDAQLIAVLALFTLSIFFLGRRIYTGIKKPGEAGCDKCDMNRSDYGAIRK
jgi:hypothetical protein